MLQVVEARAGARTYLWWPQLYFIHEEDFWLCQVFPFAFRDSYAVSVLPNSPLLDFLIIHSHLISPIMLLLIIILLVLLLVTSTTTIFVATPRFSNS